MKKYSLEVIRTLLIMLFVYTATNKLMTISSFTSSLGRFPFLSNYASFLAIGVPVVEFFIAIVLIIPRFLKYGLWGALILIVVFTIYLSYAILKGDNLPCSCGGVISQMSWEQHLYFNLSVIAIIVFGIVIKRNQDTRTGYATLTCIKKMGS